MAKWFMSKAEKEIYDEERQAAALEKLKENLNVLETQRAKLVEMAAKADIDGDKETCDQICSQLIDLMANISMVKQTYISYETMVIQKAVSDAMVASMAALAAMSQNTYNLPAVRSIEKAKEKINGYMRRINFTNKAIARVVKGSNTSVKPRTEEELSKVRPMIDAAREKLILNTTPRIPINDITSEIEAEKKRLV